MSINLYDASVPVFVRYLNRLDGLVDIAESHAGAHPLAPPAILDARLAPDMLPFETQVRIAAHFALRASFPLAGQEVPPYGEFPATFDGLHAHIARAIALLNSLQPHQFEQAQSRTLQSMAGNAAVSLKAAEFLFQYTLPNFFFHLTVAFAILRGQGVALGKEQFDGLHSYLPQP